jgi:hypothetical protein
VRSATRSTAATVTEVRERPSCLVSRRPQRVRPPGLKTDRIVAVHSRVRNRAMAPISRIPVSPGSAAGSSVRVTSSSIQAPSNTARSGRLSAMISFANTHRCLISPQGVPRDTTAPVVSAMKTLGIASATSNVFMSTYAPCRMSGRSVAIPTIDSASIARETPSQPTLIPTCSVSHTLRDVRPRRGNRGLSPTTMRVDSGIPSHGT